MIRIIKTGGTIEGLDYDQEDNKANKIELSIEQFFNSARVSFECTVEKLFSKDSRFITLEDRRLLAKRIRVSTEEKILITHGTLTMVETAMYLGTLNLDKTIVLVGSFDLGSNKNTDAPFNLGYAICALQTLGIGVYIAMNGKVFSWKNVEKNVEKNRFEESMD